MVLKWLGGNGVVNYWQGVGGPESSGTQRDVDKIQSPKTGDMYLAIDDAELWVYDEGNGAVGSAKWYSLNT